MGNTWSEDDAFVLELGIVAEVDEEAKLATGRVKVIQNLGAVLVDDFRYGLEFDDDLASADQVRDLTLLEWAALVSQAKRLLCFKGNTLEHEFNFQALLIHGFEKAAALLLVHLKTGSDDLVAFLLVDDFAHE
jgi:hypothetical protein